MDSPGIRVDQVLNTCNRRINRGVAARFDASRQALGELEQDYIAAGERGLLLRLTSSAPPRAISVSEDELLNLYSGRMVPIGAPGNGIYTLLRDADSGKCALCNARDATQLDHHLPKDDHPTLAFIPTNLLPACDKCNGRKSTRQAASRAFEFFHPYFENLMQTPWLGAQTESDWSAMLVFRTDIAKDLPDELHARVLHQFGVLRLDETYGKFASSELAELQEQLKTIFGERPEDAEKVRRFLVSSANAFAKLRGINYWRAVAFKTWSLSEWFVNGGYSNPL